MHIPVLLHEVIEGMALTKGATAIDMTLGGGGYAKAMCQSVGSSGTVIGLDEDGAAIERATEACSEEHCTKIFVQANFRNLTTVLAERNIALVDAIAFDLGLSSFQIESSGRGFSFLRDEPLSMMLSDKADGRPFSAETIINEWSEEVLANIIFGYGEERFARRIAKAIVDTRDKHPLKTTADLVALIKASVPARYANGSIHPATRTFQALRIAVNDELTALSEGLAAAYAAVKPGGRIVAVSFHSLEDRIVKNFFRERAGEEGATILTKKPLTPTDQEIRMNPRSRSAKLRILQK
ncbi:MAG: 16S rRNA (cytosine(1402)-N(4))-methyltransferase RsmH [Candidatus Pacebacteria bacterium]|nr:16S rRNA (cytosine(1402)-N(4))-methyltransferase RsmH [Candidatus Paceibacterota bacterium]